MGAGVILETSFLVDLEREAQAEEEGPATSFLQGLGNRRLFTTFTVSGEIAAGIANERKASWARFLSSFEVLGWSPEVSWEYGRLFRYLRQNGLLIAANDLWIAATALAHDAPLVTGDRKHYARVPGLGLLLYRES